MRFRNRGKVDVDGHEGLLIDTHHPAAIFVWAKIIPWSVFAESQVGIQGGRFLFLAILVHKPI